MSDNDKNLLLCQALKELIEDRHLKGSFGLVVLGIPQEFPIEKLLMDLGGPSRVYASIIGLEDEYNRSLLNWAIDNGWDNKGFGFSATHAVDIRNEAPANALKLAFVWQEEERLHSLTRRGYQYIGSTELIKQVCTIASLRATNINDPQKNLWDALSSSRLSAFLSLDGILEYFIQVFSSKNDDTRNAPRQHLPLLGILRDESLLTGRYSSKKEIITRIEANVKMVECLQRADDEDRRDALRTLKANADVEEARNRLQKIYNAFLRISRNDLDALFDITLKDAEDLLSGKRLTNVRVNEDEDNDVSLDNDRNDDDLDNDNNGSDNRPTDGDNNDGHDGVMEDDDDDHDGYMDDDDEDDEVDDDLFGGGGTRGGRGSSDRREFRTLPNAAVALTVEGKYDAVKLLVDKAIQLLADGLTESQNIEVSYQNLSICVLDFKPDDLALSLNRIATSEERMGGSLELSNNNFDEFLSEIGRFVDTIDFFDNVRIQSLKEYINRAQRTLPEFEGHQLLEEYLEKRKKLFQFSDLLATAPLACLIGSEEARNSVKESITAFERLLSHLDKKYVFLRRKSTEGTNLLYKEILSLDVIKIATEDENIIILSALNPLVLWKYYELCTMVLNRNSQFTEEDFELLSKDIADLPEPLLALFLPAERYNDSDQLGYWNRIGSLPIYRSISIEQTDLGDNSISTAAEKLGILYPPVKENFRIMLIDPVSTQNVVRALKKLFKKSGFKKVTVIIAKTSTVQTYSNISFDSVLDQLTYQNKISIEVLQTTKEKLREYLIQKPVHLMVVSGEKIRNVELIESQGTKLHPLSIPHRLKADPILGTVSILPRSMQSEEDGLKHPIGLYQSLMGEVSGNSHSEFSLMERKQTTIADIYAMIPNSQFVLTLGDLNESFNSEEILRLTQNMGVIGDSVFTHYTDRIIKGLSAQLRRLNYSPSTRGLKELLRTLQQVSGEGIFSTISEKGINGFSETTLHGQLGNAVALNWYKNSSSSARSVVISLDSYLARRWLSKRENRLRSDFLGIREKEDGTLSIDIIEVKSYEATDDNHLLDSHPVKQLRSISSVIYNMLNYQGDILIDRRRELLRLQIFREGLLANNNIDPDWIDTLNEVIDGSMSVKINLILVELSFENNISYQEQLFQPGVEAASPVERIPVKRIRLGENDIQRYLEGYVEPINNNRNGETTASNVDEAEDSNGDEADENNTSGHERNTSSPEDSTESNEPEQSDGTGNVDESTRTDVYEVSELISQNNGGRNAGHQNVNATSISESNQHGRTEITLGFEPSEEERELIDQTARKIYRVLQDIGIRLSSPVDPNIADIGPSLIRYKIRLQTGERVSNLQNRSRDLMREFETEKEPIIDNLPNTNYVYIDLPRSVTQNARLLPLLESIQRPNDFGLHCPIGVTPDGKVEWLDVTSTPHMLIAGSTGSGKTMFLYSLVYGLTRLYSPSELQLILIDPKQTDFVFFNDLPHLRDNRVITEPEEAIEALMQLLNEELTNRTNLLVSSRCRNIKSFNQQNPNDQMATIVVFIDEFADLADVMDRGAREEFDLSLRRLAQRARNVGIHLIVATQRPTADIVNGTLKSNLPCRISFKLASQVDSRTILDRGGAEHLLGNGDMLVSWMGQLKRLQGFFVPDEDIFTLLEI